MTVMTVSPGLRPSCHVVLLGVACGSQRPAKIPPGFRLAAGSRTCYGTCGWQLRQALGHGLNQDRQPVVDDCEGPALRAGLDAGSPRRILTPPGGRGLSSGESGTGGPVNNAVGRPRGGLDV